MSQVVLILRATSGRDWLSERVLRCFVQQGPNDLGFGSVIYSAPPDLPLPRPNCISFRCPCAVLGGRRGWVGRVDGWEDLKGRACEAVVKCSGVLSPPARCFPFSCPLFILLIFISTERFGTDGNSQFNPLEEAGSLAECSIKSSNMFERCSQV